ncbi:3-ketoacyl-CoA thiolase with broad chain length specificity [Stylosanthes scabra]|uniref:3-ketoacyl-CoA thiolase with broad chain length specificity n=1 Tax=Stylosanthes scabra TaxID=79078 RepID=A0ABU6UXU3_9FABA|nr:3-ketoacyl-CoA thiolase with broad chain length specificity [Stylosanthes scabra]
MEQGTSQQDQNLKRASCATVLTLAYQSLGVVYGDLSTSPLYVYKTTFSGKLSLKEDDEEIFGVLSFIFWTFTIIALFKYVFIVMSADDNGEGGTFALYSLLCRNARLSILPNQQPTDEKLSAYATEDSADTWQSSLLKLFFEKHPRFQRGLLIFVLLGTCMAIGDGVITPAISVLSAVSGVKVKISHLHDNYVVVISCIILVGLFSIQHHGTHRVAFLFAPVVAAWLLCISGIGIYNIFHWNPKIYLALSPFYMIRFIRATGVEGWLSLGGVVLSITGVETMFADLGHFSALSIKIAFTCLVYPCLILAYMGEAAFLSKHHDDVQRSFYKAIPGKNSLQRCVLASVHSSHYGSHCRKPSRLAVTTVMFVTTCLMTLVVVIVWKQGIIKAIACLLVFGSIELLYISACICKVHEGGWIPLVLSFTFMSIMYTWNYGTMKKHQFDVENKVSLNRILSMGPSLGMVRVPGIGLMYTNLASGFPAMFGHFVTNLPAFHQVLVFVCVKSVQVPYVSEDERLIVSRVGPKEYAMFRCIVRYGYKDMQQENYNFENRLVSAIVHFVETEEEESNSVEQDTNILHNMVNNSYCEEFQSSCIFQVMHNGEENPLKNKSLQILNAKESGVTYMLGHSYAKAKKSSSIVKKIAIDVVFAFLSKNCREPDVVLNIAHSSLLEVGMVYYV